MRASGAQDSTTGADKRRERRSAQPATQAVGKAGLCPARAGGVEGRA
jgi:hypothetical protein